MNRRGFLTRLASLAGALGLAGWATKRVTATETNKLLNAGTDRLDQYLDVVHCENETSSCIPPTKSYKTAFGEMLVVDSPLFKDKFILVDGPRIPPLVETVKPGMILNPRTGEYPYKNGKAPFYTTDKGIMGFIKDKMWDLNNEVLTEKQFTEFLELAFRPRR